MDNFFSALIDKVNDALFEILGLLLPSLTLCVILLEPVFYMKSFSLRNIPISDFVESISNIDQFWLTVVIIVIFYVVGNVIKVVSKFYYDLGKALFDDTVFKFAANIINPVIIKRRQKGKSECKLKQKPVFIVIYVLFTWIKKTLSFSIINYDNSFEAVYIDLAVNKLKIFDSEQEKRDKWYLFYKEATTILKQKKIDTLYYKHLAKYNSFRSLECVFAWGIIYNMCFTRMAINNQFYYIILGVNIVSLVSFHEKYKRYWRLCGNEVISGLDYFYRHGKGNKESE